MKLTNNLYFYPERGRLDCNTYVITGKPSVLIDPGSSEFLPALVQDLSEDGISPKDIDIIANTHLHGDHSWANEDFKKLSGAEIVIHPRQKEFYDVAVVQAIQFFGLLPRHFKEDRCFEDGRLNIGDDDLELVYSPGHSPESICFYSPRDKFLVCGDVIFDRNTGRVDLPGGSSGELKRSIDELSRLEIEYLLPGHMDIVTGAEKVKGNFEFVIKNVLSWL